MCEKCANFIRWPLFGGSAISLQDPGVVEPAVAAFARSSNGGLVMTASRPSR
jgi:hypothetical protein